ncbi:helix-turn-helix domain-containing protein [Enterococcus hulanensis]|uniref:helix-turn-helix domain-containing protein n=1 Tax=Enterococcus hulanensis TaxID=2559929 RepID=UPI0010F5B6BA|nr:Rgg/GadR/MutR family transcriptional regulator [Enterococcus hulanensis]
MEGKIFRELRKDRGLSLQDLADEINSRSFISKFEKGDSKISFHRLEHLLERLNVSMEEFLYLRAKSRGDEPYEYLSDRPFYMTGQFTYYLNQIFKYNRKTNESRDFSRGIQQMDALKKNFKHQTQGDEFLFLLCQLLSLNYQLNDDRDQGKTAVIDELFAELHQLSKPVVNHLYNVENWGVFEVQIFRFFQFSFPVETVHQLLRTAVSRTQKEAGIQIMQQMKFELLFGSCSTFINFRKLTWAKEALAEAETLLYDQGDLLNNTKLLFYQGWVKIISGSLETGKQNCEQAISIFRILKQPGSQQACEEMLRGILINQENPNNWFVFS